MQAMYGEMLEKDLQELVRRSAITAGWLYYHVHDSRRSDAGFLDTVLVRDGVLLWRELKKQKGRVSPEQQQWIDALRKAGQDVGVWRPFDWADGTILRELE